MNYPDHEKRNWPDDRSLAQSIRLPLRYEGVGNALRAAYLPRVYEIPGDMAALLAKLN